MGQPRFKTTVKPAFRNAGASWGLRYPIIFGYLRGLGWACWNRHTGEVVFIADKVHSPRQQCIEFSQPIGYNDSYIDQDSVA